MSFDLEKVQRQKTHQKLKVESNTIPPHRDCSLYIQWSIHYESTSLYNVLLFTLSNWLASLERCASVIWLQLQLYMLRFSCVIAPAAYVKRQTENMSVAKGYEFGNNTQCTYLLDSQNLKTIALLAERTPTNQLRTEGNILKKTFAVDVIWNDGHPPCGYQPPREANSLVALFIIL